MKKRQRMSAAAGKLDAMSPLRVLSRGYAIPKNNDGHIIRSSKEMNAGDEFVLRLNDGEKECIVK